MAWYNHQLISLNYDTIMLVKIVYRLHLYILRMYACEILIL